MEPSYVENPKFLPALDKCLFFIKILFLLGNNRGAFVIYK